MDKTPTNRSRGPSPAAILAEKMKLAEAGALKGEVVVTVKYRNGEIQGSQATTTENHGPPPAA